MSYRSEMLLFAVATSAGLLVVTGVGKLWRPYDTARAIQQLGLPVPAAVVRLLALAEVFIGLSVLVTMSPIFIAAQGLLYLAFTTWTVAALRSKVPISSCGCVGRADTPPSSGHVALNLIGIVVSGVALFLTPTWSGIGPLEGSAAVLLVGVGVWLAWNVLAVGAQAEGLVRG